MSNLFIIEDGIVKPSEVALTIYPFSDIWNRDSSLKKDIATKEFGYIEYYCSYKKDNPYYGINDDYERHQKIVKGLFPDNPDWLPDALLNDAILVYQDFQLNASPTLKHFKSARIALDTLSKFWETLDMTTKTKSGMLLHKPSDVARGLEQTATLLSKFVDLESKVQQELLSSNKTRGNRIINHFEK
jgi:hypothetical protein